MIRTCSLFACATVLAAGSVVSAKPATEQVAGDTKAPVVGSARQFSSNWNFNASTLGLGGGCDCTWFNGAFDGRDGQVSHLGGAVQFGAKAADDFYLCPGYVYDLDSITVTLLTNSIAQLTKSKLELYADCDGSPDIRVGGLLYTFNVSNVAETGATVPSTDGSAPLRVVNVTFRPSQEAATIGSGPNAPKNPARDIVLKGGTYWISAYGLTDNQCATMNMCDVTYWGTAGNGVIKGSVARKIDGQPTPVLGQYSFSGPWSSVEQCCVGCTDLAFTVCARACKVLIDNGIGDRVSTPAGAISQYAAFTSFDSRAADDFVAPPCETLNICYIEGCIYTNCVGFRGAFEIYGNNCKVPSYALAGTTGSATTLASGEATKIVDLGYNVTIDGRSLRAYRLEFHDLSINLPGGAQYWLSVGVRHTFSINERAYFCYNADCTRTCLIRFNPGQSLVRPTVSNPTPSWASVGRDFSFLIAASNQPSTVGGSSGSNAGCRADFNLDGTANVEDIFSFLSTWFVGCP
ncbi:MAG: hypothetical protein K2Q20_02260 [Phycisphaerales bacterium]|nr:hypothetical protein [Phycisphaerales bacterium]